MLTLLQMDTRLEVDVLIFPDKVKIASPEELSEWELETASQVSIPSVRLFVALYPYNPAAMSPNYEMAAEELPFVPGQIIKVKRRTGQMECNYFMELFKCAGMCMFELSVCPYFIR